MTKAYSAMASLKLGKLQSFKHMADTCLNEGKTEEILEFVDSNLKSNDQNARIFTGEIKDYMEGDALISCELL